MQVQIRLASSSVPALKYYGIGQRSLESQHNENELIFQIHTILNTVFDLQRILNSDSLAPPTLTDISISPPLLSPSSPPPLLRPQTPPSFRASTPPSLSSSSSSVIPSLSPPTPRSFSPESTPRSSSAPASLSSPTPPPDYSLFSPPSPIQTPIQSPTPIQMPTPIPVIQSCTIDLTQKIPKVKAKDIGNTEFKIIKQIGYGSYGFVSTIKNPNLKSQIITMKTIDKFSSNTREEDVQSEVQVLNYLKTYSNPYFLEFIDFYESQTKFHILTEFLDGYVDLTDPKQTVKLTPTKLEQVISNMVTGLKVLHQLGVVHRDVKLENILIDPISLNIKYIDFGLSCFGNEGAGFRRIGSHLFMAPELFYDFALPYQFIDYLKCDIWSLGMTIVELLTNNSYYDLFLSNVVLPELKKFNPRLSELVERNKDYNTFAIIEIMNHMLSGSNPLPFYLLPVLGSYTPILTRMLRKNPVLRMF